LIDDNALLLARTAMGVMLLKTQIISIPYEIDSESLTRKLHIREGTVAESALFKLLSESRAFLKPQGVYGEARVSVKQEELVWIDETSFNSCVLRYNLAKNDKVYPFLLTCGLQADEWIGSKEDHLEHYWSDVITEEVLQLALTKLTSMVREIYQLADVAMMNPGALDWPIEDQEHLFYLFGANTAGVKLTEDCLMLPIKTLSGVFFEDGNRFINCRLCTQPRCEQRRADLSLSLTKEIPT
jgi:hypothetical protein